MTKTLLFSAHNCGVSLRTHYNVACFPVFSTAFGLMQTYLLFTSNVALDICVKTSILGTVAALGGMSNGAPNPNLVPLIVLDLGKSPAGLVMLGLPSDRDEH